MGEFPRAGPGPLPNEDLTRARLEHLQDLRDEAERDRLVNEADREHLANEAERGVEGQERVRRRWWWPFGRRDR